MGNGAEGNITDFPQNEGTKPRDGEDGRAENKWI